MKMRRVIRKAYRLALLITIGILGLAGLMIYAILHNYISKINFVNDNLPPIESVEKDPDIKADDNKYISDKSLTDTAAGFSIQENKKESLVYEVSQDIDDKLNMQEETNDQSTMELPVIKQDDGKVQKLSVTDEHADEEVLVEPIIDDKVTNILLIGRDLATDNNSIIESFALLTVNKRSEKLVVTRFSGQLYLNVPGVGKDRLVTAYRVGGTDLLAQTLEKNFGLIIDGFLMTDYSVYIDIVDIIGGVDLFVSQDELAPINRNIREINQQLGYSMEEDLIFNAGKITLNGKQALGYSRNWYTDDGEFISYGNQKAVVLSILDKVKGFNLIEMNNFLNEVLPKVTTNLPKSRIMEFILLLPLYLDYGIDYISLPVKGTEKKIYINGYTVLDYNSEQNLSKLHSTLYAMN